MTKVLIAQGRGARAAVGCVMLRHRDLVEIPHQRSDHFRSTSGILLMLTARNLSGHEQGGIGVPVNGEWPVLG
jgi:hypothetical protein